jgi:hypothetical protein
MVNVFALSVVDREFEPDSVKPRLVCATSPPITQHYGERATTIALQVPIILQQYCLPHNYGNCYAHIMSLDNVLKKKQLHFQIFY